MDSVPAIGRLTEHLGDSEIPPPLRGVIVEHHDSALDEREPRDTVVRGAVQELELARARPPLWGDGRLASGGVGATKGVPTHGADDRAVRRQGVAAAIAVDP